MELPKIVVWPEGSEKNYETTQTQQVRATRKRYAILFMFVVLQVINSFQWICLASITNVVTKFYGVDNMAINSTTVVFMLSSMSLSLPVSWLMTSCLGMRRSMIIGSFGVTLGVIIKCFSYYPNGFLLYFAGHLMIGLSEPFFQSVYSQLASIWFPDNQVSLATSVGVLGDELGTALGFIIPSLVVGQDAENFGAVQRGLIRMSTGIALIAGVNFLCIMVFFDEQPKHAPGLARLNQIKQQESESSGREADQQTIARKLCLQIGELRNLLTNRSFVILLIGFGLSIGTNNALQTVLNQILLAPFIDEGTKIDDILDSPLEIELPEDLYNEPENDHQTVGNTGLILDISGLAGLLTIGCLLDRWHRYKLLSVACYSLSLLSMLIYTGIFYFRNELVLYLTSIPLGFFIAAYAGCGYEYGVELTYPRPELLTSTLLNMSSQIFGVPITFAASYVTDNYGNLATGLFFSSILLFGLMLSCLQRGELRRQIAVQDSIRKQQLVAKFEE